MEQEPTPINVSNGKKQSAGAGPVVAIVVIMALLAVGGVYYLTTEVKELHPEEPSTIVGDEDRGSEEALRNQSSSTELSTIEADLNATDFSELDEASDGFDSELQAN